MKTLAEYFGFRPTKFLPNGCGAGLTAKLVPDELGGANFDDCCDLHDLAYHVGKGGFLGIFYTKPKVDFELAVCMMKRFSARERRIEQQGGPVYREVFAALATAFVPWIYFLGLTSLGFSPLTWPWKERPMPSHEDLARLLAHNKED